MEIWGQELSFYEIFGTLSGIAGVWLTIRKNIWCFPAGLVNVGLYGILFFREKLYADAILQVFYVLLLVYGWIQWKKSPGLNEFYITPIKARSWFILVLLCLFSTFIIGTVLKTVTDASLPYLDSFLTSMSLIAQWMVAKKKIENWIVWIVADIIYVGMYFFKNLHLTAALYFVFILLALKGYNEWKKKIALNA
ncbi:MAG: nicotinamide riboside transporter PnuC [Bacteroidetes bacterium]|nr:nicotinamide riboside transporter PnuC [Bacteroidota bacterium]